MTYVSYFFIALSVLFGAAALVMYFALDIRRCWGIVRGRYAAAPKAEKPYAAASRAYPRAYHRSNCEATEKLDAPMCEATLLLASEDTVPLETMNLVQDITIIDAG